MRGMRNHFDLGIELVKPLFGCVQLGPSDVRRGIEYLALNVGQIDDIEIHDTQGADARRGKIQRKRGTQSAGTNAQNTRLLETLLSLQGHFRHD